MQFTRFFLHGLDSSSKGTKGQWFRDNFPDMLMADFTGTLSERMEQLEARCQGLKNLILVGSSFGGLMATEFAIRNPSACAKLILLAPALNFEEYSPPVKRIKVPTLLVIGKHDTVTPPDLVLPMAERSFAEIDISVENDDHMLHAVFPAMPWAKLLEYDEQAG